MPQQVSYQVKVTMTTGRVYHTITLTSLATDDAKVPDLFDALTEHVVGDYAKEKAAGRLWDIRSVRDTRGITVLHPDHVESVEVIIVGVGPADPVRVEDVVDELDYDARLAQRFPDLQFPDTELPPTDVSAGGSVTSEADQQADSAGGVVLDPPGMAGSHDQSIGGHPLNSGPESSIADQDHQDPVTPA